MMIVLKTFLGLAGIGVAVYCVVSGCCYFYQFLTWLEKPKCPMCGKRGRVNCEFRTRIISEEEHLFCKKCGCHAMREIRIVDDKKSLKVHHVRGPWRDKYSGEKVPEVSLFK